MIRVTIEMRYSTSRQREAVAWFVPGETPHEWLQEHTRWGVPLAAVRLWIVPRSLADRTPCGVLVTGATGSHNGASVPYGDIAERLFVPVEAAFVPPLDEAQWRALLPGDDEQGEKTISVWHPTAGFVTFEAPQGLRVAELLQAPSLRTADWNHARPGVVFNSRLTAVVPLTLPTPESVLDVGRDDIGSRGDEWSELPRGDDEPSEKPLAMLGSRAVLGMVAAGQAAAGAVASAAAAIGNGLRALIGGAPAPASGSAPSGGSQAKRSAWSLALEKAAQRMLERMRQSLEPVRNKALRRLMELLEKNPDEGLKYALSFGGDQHRGAARPSDRLPERPVNFDLKQLSGGGGPADRWDMPTEMALRLMARYRELANREMRLGRYRRAAYIFGHLLNDLPAAANVLVIGKHWREAAVLYRDKLQQPLEAARCLEQGGLLTEAIELYVEQELFEKAGDLHARLEQPDEARRAWMQAVQHLVQLNDFLAAARLTDTKLANPEGALELVDAGWSRTVKAVFLAEAFQLLARMGRHSETSQRITRWRDAKYNLPAAYTPLLVQQLATITATYPDGEVQHLASDSARVLTARQWESCNARDRERLLDSINSLAPEDRLLARDTRRFLARPNSPASKLLPISKPTSHPKQSLRLVREWTLPTREFWLTATSSRQYWFVIGQKRVGQAVIRGDWSHDWSAMLLADFGEPKGDPLLLSVAAEDHGPLVVRHHCGLQKTVQRWQPHSRDRRETLDRPPTWLHKHTVALCRQPGIAWVLRDEVDCFVVEGYDEQSGLLLHTQQVHHALAPEPQVWPTPFLVDHSGRKYITEGEVLHLPHYDGVRTSDRGAIQSLAGMTFEHVTRLVLTFESGGEVLWDDGKRTNSARLSDDYSHPVAAFTRRGHLVVADRSTCEVFNADGHELRFRARGPQPTAPPLAVLPAPHLDQFALVTADGKVLLFEVPRP